MHGGLSPLQLALPLAAMLAGICSAPSAAGADAAQASFVSGDFFVAWRSGSGADIMYRGIPLLSTTGSELVVHRAWEQVFYRNSLGEPTGRISKGSGDATILTVTDRTEHFHFEKRIIARTDGTLRIEYAYEVLEPAAADLQVLFNVGAAWLEGARYHASIAGQQREGALELPQSGRTDPWAGATEQAFATDYGTLTVRCERGLNLLCRPDRGAMWWAQQMRRGEIYRAVIDVAIVPGPAADTGIALTALQTPERVRDGRAAFALGIARSDRGPRRISVQAQTTAGDESGPPVTVAISAEPTLARAWTPVSGMGQRTCEIIIADADSGEQLLRLGPLHVRVDPFIQAMPRQSLYTDEEVGEIMLRIAEDLPAEELEVIVRAGDAEPITHTFSHHSPRIPLGLDALPEGLSDVRCQLVRRGDVLATATTQIRKAPPKPNEVKIDHATGSLIADGLPFIPFGFYTYFPLTEGVMDEEVVRGFTLFSPYHRGPHDAEELAQIRAYLDRCAQIGMRVNYHLMWANRREMTEQQWAQLREEVEMFRDHPALLTWYIADEPSADRVEHLERVYALVKELDPHHPVTIVFYRGAEHARLFDNCTDIVMGDPYPIPNNSVTYVSTMADALSDAFGWRKPLWIVPQAFGGNEWWRREPTAAEQRVMTYLALIHGARGIQYFIRSPRISFPKSPIMWSECGQLALETSELTPALASDEPRPEVAAHPESVHVAAFRHGRAITVLAVNTVNEPQEVRIALADVEFSGDAKVLFENRTVAVREGVIDEFIDAFGTRAYRIEIEEPATMAGAPVIDPDNLVVNPSWEDNPSTGTPAGCYASVGPGATFFVDPRLSVHGEHSARLIRPDEDGTVSFRPYPFAVEKGRGYRISIWAKARTADTRLTVTLGRFGSKTFEVTDRWARYEFTVTPDADASRAGLAVELATPGTVWLDLLQVVPLEDHDQ